MMDDQIPVQDIKHAYFNSLRIPGDDRQMFIKHLDVDSFGFKCFELGIRIQELKYQILKEFQQSIGQLVFWAITFGIILTAIAIFL